MIKLSFNPPLNEPLPTDKTAHIWFKRSLLGLLALVSGVTAALIANHILEEKMTALETATREMTARTRALQTTDKETGNKIAVIVAKTLIAPGTRLGQHNLTARAMPEKWAPSYALAADDFIQLENQISAYMLQPGDMVTPALLQTAAPPTARATSTPRHQSQANDKPHETVSVLYGGQIHNNYIDTTVLNTSTP